MRKLIVCLDGTGNEIGDSETNVLKLYRSLSQNGDQLTHYFMGVGTNDSPSVVYRPLQKFYGVLGMAFGLGLEDDVLNAYRWLCSNYKDSRDHKADWIAANPGKKRPPTFRSDHIYFIGFSRGSYAARVLAGFIYNFGLVSQNNLHLIAPAFRAYRSLTDRDGNHQDSDRFRTLRQFVNILRPKLAPIRALMLFDTVASMIRLDWPIYTVPKYLSLADLGLHRNIESNPSVRIVIHALAMDERRTFFRDLKWQEGHRYYGNRYVFGKRHQRNDPGRCQFVRQRWFAGYHSDIGGSQREDRAGIGKITALWMLDALKAAEAQADAEDLAITNEKRKAERKAPLKKIPFNKPGLIIPDGAIESYFRGNQRHPYGSKNAAGIPYSAPDPYAPIHNSIFPARAKPAWSWIWALLEFLPPKAAKRREDTPVAWYRKPWPYYLPLFEPRFVPDPPPGPIDATFDFALASSKDMADVHFTDPDDDDVTEADIYDDNAKASDGPISTHEVDDSVFMRRDNKKMNYDPPNLRQETPPNVTAWWDNVADP